MHAQACILFSRAPFIVLRLGFIYTGKQYTLHAVTPYADTDVPIKDILILHINTFNRLHRTGWHDSSKMPTRIPLPPTTSNPSRLAHNALALSLFPAWLQKNDAKVLPCLNRWSHWAPGRRAAQRISADSCYGWGRVPIR
jgi:hypothetical protein